MEENSDKPERTKEVTAPRRSRTRVVIVVALFAAACAALLLWWLKRSDGGSGRVVTAPRTVTFDQPPAPAVGTAPAPGEGTPPGAPEAAARAGVKVEAVGEQLAPEALQQAATGVVQADA